MKPAVTSLLFAAGCILNLAGNLASSRAVAADTPGLWLTEQHLAGQWLTDVNGQTVPDPQSSGLTYRHGELVHIGDNSATPALRNKLLRINPATGQLVAPPLAISVNPALKQSCFARLLAGNPDWESLTWDRLDDSTLISVTEDSSKFQLTANCARRFGVTHSTAYPTLLVKIRTDKALSFAEVVAVRPVQFPAAAKVGNFPNDGIEGLAFDNQRNLYLALEKNQANAPMLFVTPYSDDFWRSDEFVKVTDLKLPLPVPDAKDHPINGLDFLPARKEGHPGYLLAAARNDDQLWVLDLSRQQPAKVVPLRFYAPTRPNSSCPPYEPLANTSIEGVAVVGDQVALVNDPWQRHYPENIQCPDNAAAFQQFSPLIFKLAIDPRWFN